MPLQFIVAFLVQLLLSVVPGLFLLIQFGLKLDLAIAFSIPVSTGLLSFFSIVLSAVGLYGASPLLIASFSVPLVVLLVNSLFNRGTSSWKVGLYDGQRGDTNVRKSLFMLTAFFGFGLAAFTILYTKNVAGFDGFVQFDDNATHLAVLEASARYGYFNALFPVTSNPFSDYPVSTLAYYPGAYYIVPALSAALTGINSATVELASASVLCGVAYPLGWYAFSKFCFWDNKEVCRYFLPVLMASTAFPLRMLIVHAPYPNLAGFAMSPAFFAAFLFAFQDKSEFRAIRFTLPLVCILTLALLHPNAAIFAVMVVSPFVLLNVVPAACERYCNRLNPKHVGLIVDILLVVAAIFIWIVLLQAGFMKSVVSFIWEWHDSPLNIARSILNGGLLLGMPQLLFGMLAFLGALFAWRANRVRWLSVSYALFSIQFIATGSGSNELKSFFSGFWYTDPERLASMLAIVMTPLVALGLCGVVHAFCKLIRRPWFATYRVVGVVAAIVFVVVNYYPYCLFEGSSNQTSFGQTFYEVDGNTRKTEYSCYSDQEYRFVQEVKTIVNPDDLILNFPFDGSAFASSVDDLNLFYPYRPGTEEAMESKTIRMGLSDFNLDSDVRSAVKSVGADYLMLLDRSAFTRQNDDGLMSAPGMNYYSDDWNGITSIDDNTPGFSLVLSDGNCRLYQIE